MISEMLFLFAFKKCYILISVIYLLPPMALLSEPAEP